MRRILLSSIAASIYSLAFSQTFTPEVGLNYMFEPIPRYDQSAFGIVYFPRLNFYEHKNSSFSIGFPLTFAWSDLKVVHFAAIDIPAEVDYNFGAGSAKENKKKLGFFIGGGYGYHMNYVHFYPPNGYPVRPASSLSGSVSGLSNTFIGAALHNMSPVSTFGPTFNAGIRMAVGHTGKNIEFRFSFMKVLWVPEFLKGNYLYSYDFDFQNTHILAFGCLFSF